MHTIVLLAQEAIVFGTISDAGSLEVIEVATVVVRTDNLYEESDQNGRYEIKIPADKAVILEISRIGYKTITHELEGMPAGSRRLINFALENEVHDLGIVVREHRIDDAGLVSEQIDELKLLPSASGNLESALPSIALGTFGGTGGELSSQYNVRGGNYDENLVYVNDFEIYRPQLISNSQQEGLSFPNINLINSLSFSSGGFKSSYGDKMSSVLDIKYKRPDSTAASLELSLLGGSAHLEGSKSLGEGGNKIRYLIGGRYKTTKLLLGSLDTKGEYNPTFLDIQTYITWDFHKDWQLGFLGNYNRSVYRFEPEERSTAIGLIDFALKLSTSFEGKELDEFTSGMGGLALTYIPEKKKNPIFLKFLASANISDENERFDILGNYRLSQIDIALGSETQGDELALLGNGTQHNYTRNFLDFNILNLQHKGGIEINGVGSNVSSIQSHFIEWGLSYKREEVTDLINEWERLDSAGYSIPYAQDQVLLQSVLKSENEINSNRMSAFVQNTYSHLRDGHHEYQLTLGSRVAYWDFNEEFLVSPRMQFRYKPLSWKRDMSFKFSSGLYAQQPLYRELRRPDGTINSDLAAQKSLHVVAGMTWDLKWPKISDKDFRFIVEAYYKKLWDLVSYDVDNVRIRYSGENDAEGYILGLDMRLNGEFVPGAESWINLSILKAREKLDGVQHRQLKANETEIKDVEYVPRPTDQFITLSMFFQDYFPNNENFKMHLNLIVGTGLPFGIKDNNIELRNTFRYSAYHRVDIGFSWLIWDAKNKSKASKNPFKFSNKTWLSLEVFNLLQVSNDASKTWIKTILNEQFAISNHLTGRRLNLRFRTEF